ncbi:MAG TPA: sigma-70 family RNA polymerase sigma factor [Candidatus Limnocylindrales bacterium]
MGGTKRADEAARRDFIERAYLECRFPVYRYLRTLTRSDEAATDLAATTFERAFTSASRFDPARPVLPWLLRIARNLAIDDRRRTRPTMSLDAIPAAAHPVEGRTPEHAVLGAERDAQLRELVLALPRSSQDAIALRYAAGLTAREIALVIGKSEEATQKLLVRALGALREAHDERR